MATATTRNVPGVLQRLPPDPSRTFQVPSKRINDGRDLEFFLSSTAYRDITTWIMQLNRSMFPAETADGRIQPSLLRSPPPYSITINNLRRLLETLSGLLDQAPPSTGPRRFGNVAFRGWYNLAEQQAHDLCHQHLGPVFHSRGLTGAEDGTLLYEELRTYLLGSFGSAQRLDYGTGHELSFIAFLGCLWKTGVFDDGEERAIVMGVVQPYLQLVRKLIMTYTLEPAGSHGVWGLDDHSFVPYIFGSAQLGPAIDPSDYTRPVPTEGSLPEAPEPSVVTNKAHVADYKDDNMYFSAIQFIYDVKKGPFWEHSPILYDISGLKDGWGKINKGMLKMYAAEVVGKFPVVQHFPFGSLFRWERDPSAIGRQGSSVHAQQQPTSPTSKDVPLPGFASATATAWIQPATSKSAGYVVPQMQNSTGIPSTRAPWANVPTGQEASRSGLDPPLAPGIATRRPPASSAAPIAPTAAPWAKRD